VTGKCSVNLSEPGGQFNLTLGKEVSIEGGRWLWKVGKGETGMQIPLGTKYQITLRDAKGALLGTSKGIFSLVAARVRPG
jgi:hypothetical protein